MWIVAKYKPKEFAVLKEAFIKILGEKPEFYIPKIKYENYKNNKLKIYEKNILNNYIICKHEKFSDSALVNLLKNSRGLVYFLKNSETNQSELESFVKLCKSHEDQDGFLKQTFFKISSKSKAKFVSGPFTRMSFNIIEENACKLKILLNNINVTISKTSEKLLYSYI